MRIGNIADLHFRGKDLEAAVDQLNAVREECIDRKVDAVVMEGDLFDHTSGNIGDADASTGSIASALGDVISLLNDEGIPTYAIDGNHDKATSGGSALLAMLPVGGFQHLYGVCWHTLYADGMTKQAAVFAFPWMWRGDAEEAVKAAFEKPDWAKGLPTLFAGHVQVGGAVLGGGRTCPEGPGTWRLSRATVEKLGQVFDRVALGDFHGRQPDLAGPGKGGYVGALRQLNHGEEGNPAGFEIWDTETGAVEWIELKAAPRYRTVEVREGEEIPKAGPGEILRVKTIDWKPSRLVAAEIESSGVTIMPVIETAERVARGGELSAGALNDPRELLGMWCRDKGHGDDVRDMLAARMGILDEAVTA